MSRSRSSLGILAVAAVLILLAVSARYLTAQTLPMPSSVATSLAPGGTLNAPLTFNNTAATFGCSPPMMSFLKNQTVGFTTNGSVIGVCVNGSVRQSFSQGTFASPIVSLTDTSTGYLGGVPRIKATQTTAPACTGNCGGAATVIGSDGWMRVTLGSSSPGNPFAVVFTNAAEGAPMCQAQQAQGTGTASVSSTTSTATGVSVNLTTAPANGQIYHIACTSLGNQ